jgi:hypothetical protein
LLRRILTVAMLMGLSACALFHHHKHLAKYVPPPAPVAPPVPPTLASGLWAILDPGCPKPSAANIQAWPACASPVWISHDKLTVIGSVPRGTKGRADVTFAADVTFTLGDPLIAQVGTQKDGYLFLALTDLAKDDQGRVIAATGAAVPCAKADQNAPLAIKPNTNGCNGVSVDAVREAGAQALQDHAALTEVAWIAAGAPE